MAFWRTLRTVRRSSFERTPASVRDPHADNQDHPAAGPHALGYHAREPGADQVCEHVSVKPCGLGLTPQVPRQKYLIVSNLAHTPVPDRHSINPASRRNAVGPAPWAPAPPKPAGPGSPRVISEHGHVTHSLRTGRLHLRSQPRSPFRGASTSHD